MATADQIWVAIQQDDEGELLPCGVYRTVTQAKAACQSDIDAVCDGELGEVMGWTRLTHWGQEAYRANVDEAVSYLVYCQEIA